MKKFKNLLMYLSLPAQGKSSVLVTIKTLSEFYEGKKNEEEKNNTASKKFTSQCRQKIRNEFNREHQYDFKRKKNFN